MLSIYESLEAFGSVSLFGNCMSSFADIVLGQALDVELFEVFSESRQGIGPELLGCEGESKDDGKPRNTSEISTSQTECNPSRRQDK